GRHWISLPRMAPGATERVHILPQWNNYSRLGFTRTIWTHIFGFPRWNRSSGGTGQICFGKCLPSGWFAGDGGGYVCRGFGPCGGYYQPEITYPRESNFRARLRNVAELLPEASSINSVQTFFVGWSQKTLVPMTVNGGTPTTRSLNMIVQPLHPTSLGPGNFSFGESAFQAQ